MILYTSHPGFHYELEAIIRMFLPECRVISAQTPPKGSDEGVSAIMLSEGLVRVELTLAGCTTVLEETIDNPDLQSVQLGLGRLLYQLFFQATGRSITWGILTGIRPVKLVRQLRQNGCSPEEIISHLTKEYLVAPQKVALLLQTDQTQAAVLAATTPKDYSLYISIPFCPTRCSYCSFVSHSIEKTWKLIPQYLEKLEQELEHTAYIAREKKLKLQTVYIGGGTPTVLTASQMDRLLGLVEENFDLSGCREFTVEAGRPDTIDREKLSVLRRRNVGRISINPQTLHDDILERIGRGHTVEEFFRAYNDVKDFGFTAINVDLIAGLEGETLLSFQESLGRIIALEPENITVHALTLKRAARLRDERKNSHTIFSSPEAMVNYSQERLGLGGWLPYYLYRQKSTIDSLENVGFGKPGTFGLYNIFIMDETHTILSVGSGGVTKVVLPEKGGIWRTFNHKYPYEYISRFEEIIARKDQVLVSSL